MSKKKQNTQAKPAQSQRAAEKPAVTVAPDVKSKIDVKELVRVAGILTAICAIIALLLAATNVLTADRIAQSAQAQQDKACEQVFPAREGETLSFEPLSGLYPDCGCNGYIVRSGDEISGCVIIHAAKGYNGSIELMVGFDMEGRVTGVSILSHGETPSLGANAAKEEFLAQYSGVTPSDALAVVKDGGTIDAVTAATISSRAVTKGVREAGELFESLRAAGYLTGGATQPPTTSPSDAGDSVPGDAANVTNTDTQEGGDN